MFTLLLWLFSLFCHFNVLYLSLLRKFCEICQLTSQHSKTKLKQMRIYFARHVFSSRRLALPVQSFKWLSTLLYIVELCCLKRGGWLSHYLQYEVLVTRHFLKGRVLAPCQAPIIWRNRVLLFLVPFPQTNPAWLNLQRVQGSQRHSSGGRKDRQASSPLQGTAPGEEINEDSQF